MYGICKRIEICSPSLLLLLNDTDDNESQTKVIMYIYEVLIKFVVFI